MRNIRIRPIVFHRHHGLLKKAVLDCLILPRFCELSKSLILTRIMANICIVIFLPGAKCRRKDLQWKVSFSIFGGHDRLPRLKRFINPNCLIRFARCLSDFTQISCLAYKFMGFWSLHLFVPDNQWLRFLLQRNYKRLKLADWYISLVAVFLLERNLQFVF